MCSPTSMARPAPVRANTRFATTEKSNPAPMACGTPRALAVLGRHQQERSALHAFERSLRSGLYRLRRCSRVHELTGGTPVPPIAPTGGLLAALPVDRAR